MARTGARFGEAEAMFEQAIALLESEGHIHPAARVSARLGEVLFNQGQPADAASRMEDALAVLSADEPDADLATLAAGLARVHFLMGASGRASELLELALEIAEALELPEVLAQALATKSLVLETPAGGVRSASPPGPPDRPGTRPGRRGHARLREPRPPTP